MVTRGCCFTRMTTLAARAAISLCLASLLMNYLRSASYDRRQTPVSWRHRTPRGVRRKRNQAARVKSLRDFTQNRFILRRIRGRIVAQIVIGRDATTDSSEENHCDRPPTNRCSIARKFVHVETGVERVSVDGSALQKRPWRETKLRSSQLYRCNLSVARPITQQGFATVGHQVRQLIAEHQRGLKAVVVTEKKLRDALILLKQFSADGMLNDK